MRQNKQAEPLRFPSPAEMRKQVTLRAQLIEAREDLQPKPSTEFERVVRAAEQRLVTGSKRGDSARDLYILARNIGAAKELGDAGCPDPLLQSLAGAAGVQLKRRVEVRPRQW